MANDVVDFQKDVIESSFKQPVLVDFWAPWCGPCRVLGPVLEKLAGEGSGRWKLAKVNTDENQELSVQYGIRGIPAVKLFVDGQVVNEFTGALPEHMVRKWLDESIPSEEAALIEAAEEAIETGRDEEARNVLEPLVEAGSDQEKALVLLARATALDDVSKAAGLLEDVSIEDVTLRNTVEAVQTLHRMSQLADQADTLPDEKVRDSYIAGARAIKAHDWDAALSAFIGAIQENRYYDDDGARKACIAIFSLLGPKHEITVKHRRMFDMVLY